MKSFKLKKLVAMALTLATVATVSPVAASAAWKSDSHGWWNTEGSSYSTGWRKIDGVWYLFGADGYMKTGWAMDNGTWYYLQSDGAMKTGWIYNSFDNKWYYTNESGAMQTGFITDAGEAYYLDVTGGMLSGWFQVNGAKYYANYSGEIQKGVIKIVDNVYYFNKDGKMVTGEVTIDGTTYTFASTGECKGTAPKYSKAYDANGKEVTDSAKNSDSDDDNKVSHSGGGRSHHHKSNSSVTNNPEAEKVEANYASAAGIKVDKIEGADVKYQVKFTTDDVKTLTDTDYVTRDIMLTNAVVEKKENGVYIVKKIDETKPAEVKSVVRVVTKGIVYYVNSAEQEL